MSPCLCSHDRDRHSRDDKGKLSCDISACGCGSYRPRPAVADEAEAWLAGRTPDQDAPREAAS